MKRMVSGLLGNLFEHYDSALFGFLSPFLAPIIFPEQDPITALILTYAIIPLGLLARPLGSLVFGYIGDVYGRERALFLTLCGMAIVSVGMALIPTYSRVGLIAPLLFCIARGLQNFFASGETMGGAIYLLEHTSENRRDFTSGLYSASAMGGHLLASLGVYTLAHYQAVDPGWRILYVCGGITALFGCMIRYASPTKPQALYVKPPFWAYRKELLCIILCSGFAHATYSIALVFMNGFIPLISPVTKAEIMKINTYLLLLDFCALPFFGWVASKIKRERLMLAATVGVLLFSIPLFSLLEGASLAVIIGCRLAFVLVGVAFFAPFHAWAQTLIPTASRYAIISFGYAVGTQALGSPTAALALWCFQVTHDVTSVAWYWIFLAAASSLSIIIMKTKPVEAVQ